MDYSATINLPKTDFPMRASLPQNEPKMIEFWDDMNIYKEIRRCRKGAAQFILHDGPPYSNGSIHLGQTLNKILKDIVVKYKTSAGFDSPFIPGWDTHGLPNELATIKKHKLNPRKVDPVELREKCAEHALHYLEVQKGQFRRLGIFGEWEKPYITLMPEYEANIIRVFGEMAKKGMVYRGLKPVHWCPTCVTALAEAEIEYQDKKSNSIYVKFPIKDRPAELFPEFTGNISVLIWTTTPWTLPANVAIALNPDADYSLMVVGDEGMIVAKCLADSIAKANDLDVYTLIGSMKGCELKGVNASHPFLDRDSVLIDAPYVELDDPETAGTGCVHTAPGHGREDFESGQRYSLPVLVPVDEHGILTSLAGPFAGVYYKDANDMIINALNESQLLLKSSVKEHSYPHCWRCHGPVIFRATKQWFLSVDSQGLRDKALKEIDKTRWIPEWGHDRIKNMVLGRPDWCLSRQRIWGTPIPAFYCDSCDEVLFNEDTIGAVEKLFAKEGSDSWYKKSAREILPSGYKCPHCKGTDFTKEKDIFDVWFDSSVSHEAVMGTRSGLTWPADMYLEGSDQHRGWFQVSLLTGTAVREQAPFRSVLTHGWVLDGHGNAMHKSLGNVIDPADMVKKYGAEILRLFIASVDYTADMRFSDEALLQISEVYKKIRNSCRFLLGNLYDFNPEKNSVKRNELLDIDRWIITRKDNLLAKMKESYEEYQFHVVYYYLQSFCSTELSAMYMDVVKDRLYTSAPNSLARRSAQTAMYEVLYDLIIAMSPILSFTSEEIWRNFFAEKTGKKSVFTALWPQQREKIFNELDEEKWNLYNKLRSDIYVVLEEMRKDKVIKQSLEAAVSLYLSKEYFDMIAKDRDYLKSFLIVSQLNLYPFENKPADAHVSAVEGIVYSVASALGEKCVRCWNYFTEDSESLQEALCKRCGDALNVMAANK